MLSDDFLDTAQRLANGTTEGDWRSAISRAYYSAFHFFLDWFRQNGLDLTRGREVHQDLYFAMNNCGVPEVEKLAGRLDDLRKRRATADYRPGFLATQSLAQKGVDDSSALLTDFQSLFPTASVTSVVDGARAYLISIGRIRP